MPEPAVTEKRTDESSEQADSPSSEGAVVYPESKYSPPPPKPRRSASDWSQLASELGIESVSEPEHAPTTRQEAIPFAEDLSPPFQALETPSEIISEVVGETPDDLDDLPMPVREDWKGEEEERTGRRRRRRRRGRRGERTSESAESSESEQQEVGEDWEEAAKVSPEEEPEEPVDELGEDTRAARSVSSEEERPERRSRRRRGRGDDRPRGGERRREREEAGPTDEDLDEEPLGFGPRRPAEEAEVETSDEELDGDDRDLDDEHDDEDHLEEGDKAAHRAIPSWFDAVNLVISANMESRAKNPERGNYGRGRGRGNRNHGGRDRSSGRGPS